MITLELDQPKVRPNERLTKALVLSIGKEIFKRVKKAPSGIMAVSLTGDKRLHDLNRDYRHKDKVTDVLSFSYIDESANTSPGMGRTGGVKTLGDVIISLPQARRQATGSVKRELVDLIVHGCLHVLGYDHEVEKDAKVMLPLQDSIVDTVL